MPRPKKQSTLDLERLHVIGSQRPDLLTHEEIQQLASGAITAKTPARNGRRKKRKTRADKGVKRVAKTKSTKKKIPKALEKKMVAELTRQRRTGKIKPKRTPTNGVSPAALAV